MINVLLVLLVKTENVQLIFFQQASDKTGELSEINKINKLVTRHKC